MPAFPSFGAVLTGLKIEIGEGLTPSSSDLDETLKYLLNKHYRMLFDKYWADQRLRVSMQLSPGQTLYTPPNAVTPQTIYQAYILEGNIAYAFTRGIPASQYALPVTDGFHYYYDWVSDANTNQLEVVPTPTKEQTVWFETRREYRKLVDPEDLVYIDEVLLILSAAVDYLAKKDVPVDATLAQLDARRTQLESNMGTTGRITNALAGTSSPDLNWWGRASVYEITRGG